VEAGYGHAQLGEGREIRVSLAEKHGRELAEVDTCDLCQFALPVGIGLRDLQVKKRADERTRTAVLLITSALLHILRYIALSGKGA
jgi:hypothetical protein